MKKLIALFVFVSLYCEAQNTNYPTVAIKKLTPDTVCLGSVLDVIFSFTPSNGSMASVSTTTITATDQNNNIFIVWSGDQAQILVMPTMTVNGVKCHILHWTLPLNFYASLVTGTKHLGHGTVYAANGPGNMNFVNRNCSYVDPPPNLLGIHEYELNQNSTPVYYDMLGSKIEVRYNELIFMQIGNSKPKGVIIQK